MPFKNLQTWLWRNGRSVRSGWPDRNGPVVTNPTNPTNPPVQDLPRTVAVSTSSDTLTVNSNIGRTPAVSTSGETISVVSSTGTPVTNNLYRPISYATTAELRANLRIPATANLFMWPYPGNPRGAFIQDVVDNMMGANDILVLPEADQSYLVNTDTGFRNDGIRHYYEMCRVRRGIVGMGPRSLIELGSKSGTFPFSQAAQTAADGGTKERIFGCSTDNSYYGNFEMRGRDLGGVAYHGLCHNKINSIIERVYANANSRGFRNSPGGESGSFGFNGSNGLIINCEVESRDATGKRVSTSPYMFNSCSNATVTDCYVHHARAGMPTCHNVTNATYTRVRSEFNGSGGSQFSGSAFNFEVCRGTVNIIDCTMYCNYQNNYKPAENPVPSSGVGNVGGHIGGGSHTDSTVFNVIRPIFDWGSDGSARPAGNRFDFQFQPTYDRDPVTGVAYPQAQLSTDFHVTDANGNAIPFKVRS